jgi:hypothetical protein
MCGIKTKSIWGKPPSRLYLFIHLIVKTEVQNVCIVGCSDGKFVMPFLRKGYRVFGYDIDKIALYGGEKKVPLKRAMISRQKYSPSAWKITLPEIPSQVVVIDGLKKRAEKEKLSNSLSFFEQDFYHNPPLETFDVVFTSCSMQYENNRDIPITKIIEILQNHVNKNGFLYMDYMMPLEDRHTWKAEHFLRSGQMEQYFSTGWDILSLKEMRYPIFEAAHVEIVRDHFHRFGYLLAHKATR